MKIRLLFLIFCINVVTCFEKRDYTKRLYYTIHTTKSLDIQQIASSLNARYEGQVGELKQYHWISIPISSPHIIEHALQKRNLDIRIQPQIPSRRLFKRVPPIIENTDQEYKLNNEIPPTTLPSLSDINGYQEIKSLLNITDPGFDQQWHLVSLGSLHKDHMFNVFYS